MSKLMLVEDDNNLREIYEARLQAEGYVIVSASDGEEALVVAKAEQPDLIITDVMMPKISGFEMLDILRNTDGLKDVKVIMLTALGQDDDQQRADRLGADRYLVKSQVTLEDIVKVTHDLLDDQPAPESVPEPEPIATQVPEPVAAPVTPVPAPEPAAPAPTPPTATPVPEPVKEAPAVAPAAVPEPIATPVPEPVAAPVTPVPEPVKEAPAVAAPALEPTPAAAESEVDATAPQSESQEEADVEAKIEDFVAGATEEATPPVGVPSLPPPTNKEPGRTPETSTSATSKADVAADDKLMDDAVKTLVDSTSSKDTAGKPDVDAPTVVKPSPPEPVAADVKPEAPPKAKPSGNAIAHKLVITPIDSTPKTDIGALLAIEDAKEAAATGQAAPSSVVSQDISSKAPGSAPADGKVDPRSIAL